MRRAWTPGEIAQLCALYPTTPMCELEQRFGRYDRAIYAKASTLGLKRSAAFLASPASGRRRPGHNMGGATRFQAGHAAWNKGKRYMPGGRVREGWFKPGQVSKRWDPEAYQVGALRMNADGFVDIKLREGARAWRAFHRVLWEDTRGPVPPGFAVCFKDGDRLNLDVDNFELVSRANLMRRNTVHNLPPELKSAIQLLGCLKRKLRREEQDRGSAQSPVRDAGSAA